MDITGVLDVFSSGGVGALFGVVGGWLSKRQELQRKKLDLQEKIALAKIRMQESNHERDHELSMANKNMERANLEGEIQSDLKLGDAFIEATKDISKSTGVKWVDALKGAMRPVLTIYLVTLTTIVTIALWGSLGGLDAITHNDGAEMLFFLIRQLVFLTIAAVSFWYCARPGRFGDKGA